jgi:hypothetical protein
MEYKNIFHENPVEVMSFGIGSIYKKNSRLISRMEKADSRTVRVN